MTRLRTGLIVATLALLAGCATPETRIRTTLIEVGLPERQAACMASRMVDDLSVAQLLKLQKMSKAARKGLGQMSIRELVDLARRAGDPEILAITTRAGLGCAFGGANR